MPAAANPRMVTRAASSLVKWNRITSTMRPRHHVARDHQDAPLVAVGHVAIHGDAPQQGAHGDDPDGERHPRQLQEQPLEGLSRRAVDGALGRIELVGKRREQRGLLAERRTTALEELHPLEQLAELPCAIVEGAPAGVGSLASSRSRPTAARTAVSIAWREPVRVPDEPARRRRHLPGRAPRALEREEAVDEGAGARRHLFALDRGHHRRGRRRRLVLQLGHGVLHGLDLVGQVIVGWWRPRRRAGRAW